MADKHPPAERIEEDWQGYYARHGDVLEWHWSSEKAPGPPAEDAAPAKRKRTASKRTTSAKARKAK